MPLFLRGIDQVQCFPRVDDRDVLIVFKDEEIEIAADDQVHLRGDRAGEDRIVVRIAADGLR